MPPALSSHDGSPSLDPHRDGRGTGLNSNAAPAPSRVNFDWLEPETDETAEKPSAKQLSADEQAEKGEKGVAATSKKQATPPAETNDTTAKDSAQEPSLPKAADAEPTPSELPQHASETEKDRATKQDAVNPTSPEPARAGTPESTEPPHQPQRTTAAEPIEESPFDAALSGPSQDEEPSPPEQSAKSSPASATTTDPVVPAESKDSMPPRSTKGPRHFEVNDRPRGAPPLRQTGNPDSGRLLIAREVDGEVRELIDTTTGTRVDSDGAVDHVESTPARVTDYQFSEATGTRYSYFVHASGQVVKTRIADPKNVAEYAKKPDSLGNFTVEEDVAIQQWTPDGLSHPSVTKEKFGTFRIREPDGAELHSNEHLNSESNIVNTGMLATGADELRHRLHSLLPDDAGDKPAASESDMLAIFDSIMPGHGASLSRAAFEIPDDVEPTPTPAPDRAHEIPVDRKPTYGSPQDRTDRSKQSIASPPARPATHSATPTGQSPGENQPRSERGWTPRQQAVGNARAERGYAWAPNGQQLVAGTVAAMYARAYADAEASGDLALAEDLKLRGQASIAAAQNSGDAQLQGRPGDNWIPISTEISLPPEQALYYFQHMEANEPNLVRKTAYTVGLQAARRAIQRDRRGTPHRPAA